MKLLQGLRSFWRLREKEQARQTWVRLVWQYQPTWFNLTIAQHPPAELFDVVLRDLEQALRVKAGRPEAALPIAIHLMATDPTILLERTAAEAIDYARQQGLLLEDFKPVKRPKNSPGVSTALTESLVTEST